MAREPRLVEGGPQRTELLRDELLLLAFGHLTIGSLAACRSTCRRWRQLAAEAVGLWARNATEPRSAACLCTEPTKASTIAHIDAFVRGLTFRPNLGIVTLSSTHGARQREEIFASIGRSLPPDLILVGQSCSGAIGPAAPGGHPVEYENGATVTLHLQWLPESTIHLFAMQATGKPIVDIEPSMRTTRSGKAKAAESYFDVWMAEIHKEPNSGATGGGGLLVFTATQTDDAVQQILDLVEGYRLPVIGGHASGASPRVYLYSAKHGGLLTTGARTHTVFVCIRSAVCAMRTCVVCEEWGAGAAAQAAAMRHFVRSERCAHFAHRLLSHGPPLETVHAAFIVSCIGRGRDFHGGAIDCESRALVSELAGHSPTLTGFFSQGEIGPSGQVEPLSHQFACAVALFGRPTRETDAERARRFHSRCGFRACVCDSVPAGPFDEHFMAFNVPFQPPEPEAGAADAADGTGAQPHGVSDAPPDTH